MKKKLLVVSMLVTGGLLAACGTPGEGGAQGGDDQDSAATNGGGGEAGTITVALIPPSSGALAEFGSDAARAWEYAVEQANAAGGVAGYTIELKRYDTDATAAATLRTAREAVTQDGASFIGAVMTSTEHGALNAQLESLGVISFNGLGKDDALTGADCNPNHFRVVQSTSMDINALAASIEEFPVDSWAIQAVDYSTGHTSAEVFSAAAEEAGKEVVLEQFAPLNTTEFGTYISTLESSDADGLFAVEYGADGVAFVNQMDQFGLADNFDVVLGFNMVSEPLFDALGDKIVGFYNNLGYDVDNTTEMNQEFVAGWEAEHGEKPYYVVADNYIAAQTLFAGIEAAGSGDPMDVREALKDLTFETIEGTVTMRGADNQMIRPTYLGQVVEEDGELAFKAISKAEGADIMPEPDPDCQL